MLLSATAATSVFTKTPFERVSAERAHQLQGEGYTFVDVRSEPEYAAGHPVGAYNVPVMNRVAGRMQPNPRFLAVMQSLFASDTKLLVSCQGGVRSARAAQQLIDADLSHETPLIERQCSKLVTLTVGNRNDVIVKPVQLNSAFRIDDSGQHS